MAKSKNSGSMTTAEAGKKGGEATKASHSSEFYHDIGTKGGHKGGQRVRDLIERGKKSEG